MLTSMHEWEFAQRFRSGELSWKTQPAVKEVKAAVREIKKVAKKEPELVAEGVTLFFENISQGLSNVDTSAGAIVGVLAKGIAELVAVFAKVTLTPDVRRAMVERIYQAYRADQMGVTESLGDLWGSLCSDKDIAGEWADALLEECKLAWGPERGRGYIARGMPICLSSLLFAGRYPELLELLDLAPRKTWTYHHFGVRALAAQEHMPEALEYAKEAGEHTESVIVAKLCEELLLEKGLVDDAYRLYGLQASETNTYQAWYRSVIAKYSHKTPAEVLADLAAHEPGHEGKWFAAAKSAKLYDEAIELVRSSPCSPETLVRAARDYGEERPGFAIEAGIAALRWLAEGHGYDKTEALVHDAFDYCLAAAKNEGSEVKFRARIKSYIEGEALTDRFVRSVLIHKLENE